MPPAANSARSRWAAYQPKPSPMSHVGGGFRLLRSATSFFRQDRDVTALAAFENAISEKTKAKDHGHPRHVDLAFGAAWLRGAPRQKSARRVPNVGHRIPPNGGS
jgi:hypothetical protein